MLGIGLVVGVIAVGAMSSQSEWLQNRKAQLVRTEHERAVETRMSALRERQEIPPPPTDHVDALIKCSEAQDLAVSVSMTNELVDARLANQEMERACKFYFASAVDKQDEAAVDRSDVRP